MQYLSRLRLADALRITRASIEDYILAAKFGWPRDFRRFAKLLRLEYEYRTEGSALPGSLWQAKLPKSETETRVGDWG